MLFKTKLNRSPTDLTLFVIDYQPIEHIHPETSRQFASFMANPHHI